MAEESELERLKRYDQGAPAGSRYLEKKAPAEIALQAAGTAAGGVAGYLLSKLLARKASKKRRLVHTLLGAATGFFGTPAALGAMSGGEGFSGSYRDKLRLLYRKKLEGVPEKSTAEAFADSIDPKTPSVINQKVVDTVKAAPGVALENKGKTGVIIASGIAPFCDPRVSLLHVLERRTKGVGNTTADKFQFLRTQMPNRGRVISDVPGMTVDSVAAQLHEGVQKALDNGAPVPKEFTMLTVNPTTLKRTRVAKSGAQLAKLISVGRGNSLKPRLFRTKQAIGSASNMAAMLAATAGGDWALSKGREYLADTLRGNTGASQILNRISAARPGENVMRLVPLANSGEFPTNGNLSTLPF